MEVLVGGGGGDCAGAVSIVVIMAVRRDAIRRRWARMVLMLMERKIEREEGDERRGQDREQHEMKLRILYARQRQSASRPRRATEVARGSSSSGVR